MKKVSTGNIADENLIDKIYFIRGQKVMIDRDLAELYGVLTKNLNLSVKRNRERFPQDFMFQLTKQEYDSLSLQFASLKRGEQLPPNEHKNLRFQIATSSWGGNRRMPYAFTEQGVAMLSSVLNSKQAIAVNIQIIRVFTKMREIISSNKEILMKLNQLEMKVGDYGEDIEEIFSVLRRLINPDPVPRKRVGYKLKKED
ncbi:MAG TPA: ORF6N domain-containing protein [Bacteroidia bacterium]|nr:ORF6N domain-containing protein [Bacteroidia bacterium]